MLTFSRRRLSLTVYLPAVFSAFALLTLARLGLMIWQSELLPDNSVLFILLTGLRFDAAAICALFALPCLITVLGSLINFLPRWLLTFNCVWVAAALAFLVMNEAATPGFINEYGVRPNQIYVKYLIYPHEVILTLWGGHKLELILSLLLTLAVFFISFFLLRRRMTRRLEASPALKPQAALTPSRRRLLAELIILLIAVPLGVRSTLGHRPLNPSMAFFCDDSLVNTLPINSSYSAVYALAHLNDTKLSLDDIYAKVPAEQVLNAARANSAADWQEPSAQCPLVQRITPVKGADKPRNVVIVLEESMGADFVESLGGLPLTPELERLKRRGWWFEQMYAAGHRSIRGIEAVSAGFPPSPMESIVKLMPKGAPYAALPEIFSAAGYHTSFIYGGESHFDNMRAYFLDNGCAEVIDQNDYQDPSFTASWGVSDEDLFARAQESFTKDYAAGKPFFALVFTSSFHDPFEIPPGKVSLNQDYGEQQARYLAVKYADYALGRFMETALASPYAQDTVFLIIADHESKVRGSGLFPLSKFRIPALIIAPGLTPVSDGRIVSQIDMPPTLLALAGFKGSVPYVGQNLTRPDVKERALVQFNNLFGLLTRDGFTVLTPRMEPEYFKVKDGGRELTKSDLPEGSAERAAALENLGPLLYEESYMTQPCVSLK